MYSPSFYVDPGINCTQSGDWCDEADPQRVEDEAPCKSFSLRIEYEDAALVIDRFLEGIGDEDQREDEEDEAEHPRFGKVQKHLK